MQLNKRPMTVAEKRWREWKKAHPDPKEERRKNLPIQHSRLITDWKENRLGPGYEMQWGIGMPLPGAKVVRKTTK